MNSISRAKDIKAIILDIDGVLTDGTFSYMGEQDEIKSFHARDGLGLKLAQRAGLIVGCISGRGSVANRRRIKELGLDFLKEKSKNKAECFKEIMADFNLKKEECLFMGDDLIDLPILLNTGISVAVANAVPEVLAVADWVTDLDGGHGAVREMVERLLKMRGQWEDILTHYTGAFL